MKDEIILHEEIKKVLMEAIILTLEGSLFIFEDIQNGKIPEEEIVNQAIESITTGLRLLNVLDALEKNESDKTCGVVH